MILALGPVARSGARQAAVLGAARPGPPPAGSASASPGREPHGALEGKRVLIVEDEFFLAMLIEDALQSLGCETIGPFTTVELAIQATRQESFDLAILDINLNGKMVFPVAEELLARGIQFVFLTGYAAKDLPAAYRSQRRLSKPFDPKVIREALEQMFAKPS